VKYAFIERQRTRHAVRRLCELLEVSPAGYYEWRGRPCSPRSTADERLRAEIVRVHAASRKTYGRPRIHAELREQGLKVGAKRIACLMKISGIQGVWPRRFVHTTDSAHPHPIAENILARRYRRCRPTRDSG
jgi:putative transposase